MSVPTQNTTHVDEARALIIDQFRGRRVIQGILDAFVGQAQDLENATFDVILKRLLLNAADAQLDSVGDLVGEPRDGRTDEPYRAAIQLRVRVNRAQGRAEDVIQVVNLYPNASPTFTYTEPYPAGFEVQAYDVVAPNVLVRAVSQSRAAGTKGNLITSDWSYADTFLLDYPGGGVADPGLLDYDGITTGVTTDLMPWGADA